MWGGIYMRLSNFCYNLLTVEKSEIAKNRKQISEKTLGSILVAAVTVQK